MPAVLPPPPRGAISRSINTHCHVLRGFLNGYCCSCQSPRPCTGTPRTTAAWQRRSHHREGESEMLRPERGQQASTTSPPPCRHHQEQVASSSPRARSEHKTSARARTASEHNVPASILPPPRRASSRATNTHCQVWFGSLVGTAAAARALVLARGQRTRLPIGRGAANTERETA